ncbi:CD3e molecule, epsilon associated protein [Nerophis ophidion]|uniref:CD3e molecule, epsilon associated protein n=1 Tax=Nerophis ophidion TaxID=159077 RepID=UPI002AE037E3|nr:CD3e molecule, epsilon associated protein [Nerophis ophidion]
MLRDVSASSSEDETDTSTEEVPLPQKELETRTSRYQCPNDFVSFRHKACSNTLTDKLKKSKSELWLIKAPASFNPDCMRGVQLSLSGLQTLKLPADKGESGQGQQVYNILGSSLGPSELHLLTGDSRTSQAMVMGPDFSGLLSVSESYGGDQWLPLILPASPAPAIPPSLKQRFHPFGSKAPAQGESEVDAAPSEFASLHPTGVSLANEEEGRKRKKKKMKKERTEREDEEVTVKSEVGVDICFQEVGAPEEKRRKKKKKKKDRDAEDESPPAATVMIKKEVKLEPVDVLYDYQVDDSAKKKKKKKKNKSDD